MRVESIERPRPGGPADWHGSPASHRRHAGSNPAGADMNRNMLVTEHRILDRLYPFLQARQALLDPACPRADVVEQGDHDLGAFASRRAADRPPCASMPATLRACLDPRSWRPLV